MLSVIAAGGILLIAAVDVCGENQWRTVKGGDRETIDFQNTFDTLYQLTALAASKWKFDGSFEITSGYNGWIKDSDTEELKSTKAVGALLFSASAFPVKIAGKIVPAEEGSGPPPPTDWSVQGKVDIGEPSIDPMTALIAMGNTQTFTYRLDGETSSAYWKDLDGWMTVLSQTYVFPPVQAYAPDHFIIQARLSSQGDYSANADAYYIGVKEISGGDITSTTDNPGAEQTIILLKGSEAISFSAKKSPESSPGWPENFPLWNPGGSKGESFTFTPSMAGEYLIEAICGISKKAIKTICVELTKFDLEHKDISATPGNGCPTMPSLTKCKVTLKTNPESYEYLFTIHSAGSTPMTFKKLSDSEWSYEGYDEPKSDRTRTLKYFLQVGVSFKDAQLQQKPLTIHRVFRWLVDFDTDHNKAWRYAQWKYNIKTPYLSHIYYNSSLEYIALTNMSSSKFSRDVQLGTDAFENENICASTLLHENVHGGQDAAYTPWGQRANEVPAYWAELTNAAQTNIDASYFNLTYEFYVAKGGKEKKPDFPN
ncbi:MAG: hypothetical protein HP058_03155 [Massilimaliae sp.]|nr:hypothetical protein [Massiliimalia sp.]